MRNPSLSLTEWAVLGLLSERPRHGFAVARELAAKGRIGRLITIRRPLVYRAIDRLVEAGLITPTRVEPGAAAPQRTVLRATPEGHRLMNRWLTEPVSHVRDLRLDFLLKVRLLRGRGRPVANLINSQRALLEPTFTSLQTLAAGADEIDLWRSHNARAVSAFLDDLLDQESSTFR